MKTTSLTLTLAIEPLLGGTAVADTAKPNIVSADDGTIVISQDNSYLWLNKGILIDMLAAPQAPTFSLDLIDEHSLQSLFSNDVATIALPKRPVPYELTLGDQRVYIAYPVKWAGLFALLSLPISTYYQVWLILLAGLLDCWIAGLLDC